MKEDRSNDVVIAVILGEGDRAACVEHALFTGCLDIKYYTVPRFILYPVLCCLLVCTACAAYRLPGMILYLCCLLA